MRKFMSAEETKKRLHVNDFNQLSEDKFRDYFMIMPAIDPEVNREIINITPTFITLSLDQIKEMIKDRIAENEKYGNMDELLEKILSDVSPYKNRTLLSMDEQNLILEKLQVIANIFAEVEKERKESVSTGFSLVFKTFAVVAGSILALIGIRRMTKRHKETDEEL